MPRAEIEHLLKSDEHPVRVGAVSIMDWQARTGRRPKSDAASCSTCTSAGTSRSTLGTSSTEARSTSSASTWSTSRGTSSTSWRVPRNRWSGEPRSSAPMHSSGAISSMTPIGSRRRSRTTPTTRRKSVGWMLREAGKRDEARLASFLDPCRHDAPGDASLFDREVGQTQRDRYLSMKRR